jgi:type IX secretion system PorP/SprF family membrane protein
MSTLSLSAQDVEFSQFYATKNYLNPAFTALSNDQTITSTYRNQWPSIKNAYDSYFVSYDRRIKGKDAGIGLYYLGDIAGEGALLKQSLAFQFSKQIRLSRNAYASFGLKGSLNTISIQWDQLVWGDMLDARNGIVYPTNQQQGSRNEKYFDTGAGFIFYSDKLQGGMSVEHINRPEHGLLSVYNTERIPLRYKLHMGGNIPLQAVPNAPAINIAPQMIYTRQGTSQQLAVGAYLTYTQFTIGTWYRVKDSFIVLVGMVKDGFRIGYSYDLGANKLISHTGGTHEISLSYSFDFHTKHKQRKYRTISCPVF